MIRIEALSKRFGKAVVLKGLAFNVSPGERVAIVGQNGSGKTTLIRCLLGLYHYQGSISVAGYEPRTERKAMLDQVGFVPQLPPAFKLTVAEYLGLIEATCEVSANAITRHAEELGLDLAAIGSRAFSALSGGMKQKLLLSAAIARRPKLLVLDEPGANLDPVARRILFAQLARLPAETTMLLSSHRVDELAGLVTRVVELDSGQIVIDDVVAHAGRSEVLGEVGGASIEFVEEPETVQTALHEWGFEKTDGAWRGNIAGPDRFRFLALVTRWSGLVRRFSIDEGEAGPQDTKSRDL